MYAGNAHYDIDKGTYKWADGSGGLAPTDLYKANQFAALVWDRAKGIYCEYKAQFVVCHVCTDVLVATYPAYYPELYPLPSSLE
jgi:hypothetical protein